MAIRDLQEAEQYRNPVFVLLGLGMICHEAIGIILHDVSET